MSLASKASKRTLYGSMVFAMFSVWGVHYAQKIESENMYQGVVKDEKRRKDRAEAKAKVSDVLPTSLSAVVPDAVNDIPLPSSSTLPSVLGFDPPQAAPAGGKSDAQKEKDYRSRQRDFELSQMRREKLLADQGLVDGDK